MKRRRSRLNDRISELPSSIIQIILMFLPLRDMLRTSVLSRIWRFQWVTVPLLVFQNNPGHTRYTADKVFGILLLHQGPILKLSLDMTDWTNCFEVDKIIPFLSRHGIQDLTIIKDFVGRGCLKLPSSIFSCVELRHLSLNNCVAHPLTFVGFDKLVSVELLNVDLDPNVSIRCGPLLESLKLNIFGTIENFSVDAPNLKILLFQGSISHIGLMCTPLLKILSFTGFSFECLGTNTFDLMNLLRSLPLLENLHLSSRFFKLLVAGCFQNANPAGLNNLRLLELIDVRLMGLDALSSTFWLIRSSPNLQRLVFKVDWELCYEEIEEVEHDPQLFLKMKEDFYHSLTNLREVELLFLYNNIALSSYIDAFKFLLSITPELEIMYIQTSYKINASHYNSLLKLVCSQRASPKAKIVISYLGRDFEF